MLKKYICEICGKKWSNFHSLEHLTKRDDIEICEECGSEVVPEQ